MKKILICYIKLYKRGHSYFASASATPIKKFTLDIKHLTSTSGTRIHIGPGPQSTSETNMAPRKNHRRVRPQKKSAGVLERQHSPKSKIEKSDTVESTSESSKDGVLEQVIGAESDAVESTSELPKDPVPEPVLGVESDTVESISESPKGAALEQIIGIESDTVESASEPSKEAALEQVLQVENADLDVENDVENVLPTLTEEKSPKDTLEEPPQDTLADLHTEVNPDIDIDFDLDIDLDEEIDRGVDKSATNDAKKGTGVDEDGKLKN